MMWGSIVTEWATLILRWLHVVAAIGWIGSSFYFIHLDLSLQPRRDLPEGVDGEAWQVHGGGFSRLMEYLGGAGKDARRIDLVQMGGLHDLAVRVRPHGRRVLPRCRTVPGRQIEPRPDPAAGRIVQPWQPRLGVAAVRRRLQIGPCQARAVLCVRRLP